MFFREKDLMQASNYYDSLKVGYYQLGSIVNNKFSDSNITSKFFIKNFICLELVRHFEIMMIYLRDPDNTRTCWIYCTVTH